MKTNKEIPYMALGVPSRLDCRGVPRLFLVAVGVNVDLGVNVGLSESIGVNIAGIFLGVTPAADTSVLLAVIEPSTVEFSFPSALSCDCRCCCCD